MKLSNQILIVEDLTTELERYSLLAQSLGLKTTGVTTFEAAKNFLEERSIDILLTDMHLSADESQWEGLDLLTLCQETQPNALCIGMSSDPDVRLCDRALAAGAHHFIKKPLSTQQDLGISIFFAEKQQKLQKEAKQKAADPVFLPSELKEKCPHGIVVSAEVDRLTDIIAKSPSISSVVFGETGTGKEEIAKLIHRKRQLQLGDAPFVSVNCATLNNDLAESLLFGHRKGAFSGADRTTNGFVGEANGGILFLDEIHTLSLTCQQKLLRVLNDGTFHRVGDSIEQKSIFQVIAASTKDLDDEVDEGTFLLDLRTRISGIDILLPPLRDRLPDLPLLIALFFAQKDVDVSPNEMKKLIDRCSQFYWRGNIRQLYSCLKTTLAFAEGNNEPVQADYLPVFKSMLPPKGEAHTPSLRQPTAGEKKAHELLERAMVEDCCLTDTIETIEKEIIEAALKRHNMVAKVYRALGLPRSTLDAKRRKYGI